MNKTKYGNALLIALLIAVVAVSGCISGGDGSLSSGGTGDDALDIYIDTEGRDIFDSLDSFIITIDAENIGEFNAENVEAHLQGYDGIIYSTDSSARLSDFKPLTPNTLDRPDSTNDVPGGTGDVDWDVRAPYLSNEAPDVDIYLVGEIMYDYKSLATRTVAIATAEEVEKLEQRGESIPIESGTDALNGPIGIEVESDTDYVRLTSAKQDFRLKISLFNDGSGTVYNRYASDKNKKADYLTKIVMKVPAGLDVDEANCDFELESPSGGSRIDSEKTLVIEEGSKNEDKLRMTQGGFQRDLNCKLTAYSDKVGGFNTYRIPITAEYTYLQSVSKDITVIGTDAAPVKVSIQEPTRSNVDTWEYNKNHDVWFTLSYQADAVEEADLKIENVKVEIGGEPVKKVVKVEWDEDEEMYLAVVTAPDLVDGLYDLELEVTYSAETAVDVESSAVEYQ
ncbi:MAG: hypothetical protein ABIG20_01960 [archaeon]